VTIWVCADPPSWVEPAGPAFCVWSADWVTLFVLVTVAFDWATVDPDEPGIQIWIRVPSPADPPGSTAAGSTEIETFAFVGATCDDVASAVAACDVGALWLASCDWLPGEPPPFWS